MSGRIWETRARRAADAAADIAIGIVVAALVVATVLMGGAVSQFVYIDF